MDRDPLPRSVGADSEHVLEQVEGRRGAPGLGDVGQQVLSGRRLEATVADLVCEDRRIWVRGAPFRSVTFGELAAQANMMTTRLLPEGMEPGLEATACYDPPSGFANDTAVQLLAGKVA